MFFYIMYSPSHNEKSSLHIWEVTWSHIKIYKKKSQFRIFSYIFVWVFKKTGFALCLKTNLADALNSKVNICRI